MIVHVRDAPLMPAFLIPRLRCAEGKTKDPNSFSAIPGERFGKIRAEPVRMAGVPISTL